MSRGPYGRGTGESAAASSCPSDVRRRSSHGANGVRRKGWSDVSGQASLNRWRASLVPRTRWCG
jgi:hypothetical protein